MDKKSKLTILAEIATLFALLMVLLAFFGYSNLEQLRAPFVKGKRMQKVAFSSDRAGNYDIYTANIIDSALDLTSITNQTEDYRGLDTNPSWSPSGDKLAFVSNRDGDNEIFIIDLTSNITEQITTNNEDDETPSWSKDGDSIAFQKNINNDWDIFIIDIKSRIETNITNNPRYPDTFPAWSPIDDKIAFVSQRDSDVGQQIYTIDINKSLIKNITNNKFCNNGPAWSPDGRFLAFVSNQTDSNCLDGNIGIYRMMADGGEQRMVVDTEYKEGLPTWTIDEKIVFQVIYPNNTRKIYISKVSEPLFDLLVPDGENSYWPNVSRN